MLLQTVRPNIVQAIRAYRVDDLVRAAQDAGHHFLYANVSEAQSKQELLEQIAQAFLFPAHFGKNLDALYDCMTDLVNKSDERCPDWNSTQKILGAINRINCNIAMHANSVTNYFSIKEHWRLIFFAFSNYNHTVHIYGRNHLAHCINRGLICIIFCATTYPTRCGNRSSFGNAH